MQVFGGCVHLFYISVGCIDGNEVAGESRLALVIVKLSKVGDLTPTPSSHV